MKTIKILVILFLTGLSIVGCKKDNISEQSTLLQKSWTHSYEESISQQYEVYRPSDYKKFPNSRYRQIFILKNKNNCEYLVLAPDDRQYMEKGSWNFDDEQKNIKIYSTNGDLLYEFELIELSKEILKLKPKR